MSIPRHNENRGTLVTSLSTVTDCIDQAIMNMIAEQSKNVSIEDAREALQEMEAREREAAQ